MLPPTVSVLCLIYLVLPFNPIQVNSKPAKTNSVNCTKNICKMASSVKCEACQKEFSELHKEHLHNGKFSEMRLLPFRLNSKPAKRNLQTNSRICFCKFSENLGSYEKFVSVKFAVKDNELDYSAQSYKHFTLINYNSRVIITSKLLILTTLDL